jgi:hypothetical protein
MRVRSKEREGLDMTKLLGAVLVMGTTILGGVHVAQAGGATDAALGLGAFAVFNQFVRGETVFHGFFPPAAPVVVQQPVIVAPPPPVVVVPGPPVYVAPPAPVVYYAVPPIGYGYRPAPVYYAPKRVPPAYYKKISPHWRKHYQGW